MKLEKTVANKALLEIDEKIDQLVKIAPDPTPFIGLNENRNRTICR